MDDKFNIRTESGSIFLDDVVVNTGRGGLYLDECILVSKVCLAYNGSIIFTKRDTTKEANGKSPLQLQFLEIKDKDGLDIKLTGIDIDKAKDFAKKIYESLTTPEKLESCFYKHPIRKP